MDGIDFCGTLKEQIEELASALMLPNDIADILEIDKNQFIKELNDETSEIYKYFKKGYLKTEFQIRKSAITKYMNSDGIELITANADVEGSKFLLENLNNFKSQLIIQLNA